MAVSASRSGASCSARVASLRPLRRARPLQLSAGAGGKGFGSKKSASSLEAELVANVEGTDGQQQGLAVSSVEKGADGSIESVTVSGPANAKAPSAAQMDAAADAILSGNKVWLRSRAKVKRTVGGGAYLTDFMATPEGHRMLLGAGTRVEELPPAASGASRFALVAPAMKFPGLTLRPTSIMEITNNGDGARLEQVEAKIEGEPEKMVRALALMTSDQTLSTDVRVSVNRDGDAAVESELRLDVGMLVPKKFPVPRKLIEGLGARLFSQALEKQANQFSDKLTKAYTTWALEQGEEKAE